MTDPHDIERQKRAIGEACAYLRKREGLTQRQLAYRLDCTDQTISDGERGRRFVTTPLLLRINAALDLEPGEVLAVAAQFIREERGHKEMGS